MVAVLEPGTPPCPGRGCLQRGSCPTEGSRWWGREGSRPGSYNSPGISECGWKGEEGGCGERSKVSAEQTCLCALAPPADRLRFSNFPRRTYQARPREDRTNHQGVRLQALLVVSTEAPQPEAESPLKAQPHAAQPGGGWSWLARARCGLSPGRPPAPAATRHLRPCPPCRRARGLWDGRGSVCGGSEGHRSQVRPWGAGGVFRAPFVPGRLRHRGIGAYRASLWGVGGWWGLRGMDKALWGREKGTELFSSSPLSLTSV